MAAPESVLKHVKNFCGLLTPMASEDKASELQGLLAEKVFDIFPNGKTKAVTKHVDNVMAVIVEEDILKGGKDGAAAVALRANITLITLRNYQALSRK